MNSLGGLLVGAIGVIFFLQAIQLPVGSLQHFGPGMFPVIVSVLLMVGGAVLAIHDLKAAAPRSTGTLPVGKAGMLLLSYLIFAVSIGTGGLAIAIPATVLISYPGFGGRSLVELILLTLILTVLCILIFIVALDQPMPIMAYSLGF